MLQSRSRRGARVCAICIPAGSPPPIHWTWRLPSRSAIERGVEPSVDSMAQADRAASTGGGRRSNGRHSPVGELVFHVFSATAHIERRLIAERTRDGIAAARAKGKRPGRKPLDLDRLTTALKLAFVGLSLADASRQLGCGRLTVYREMSRFGLRRPDPVVPSRMGGRSGPGGLDA